MVLCDPLVLEIFSFSPINYDNDMREGLTLTSSQSN
jgi:hypothetical protein